MEQRDDPFLRDLAKDSITVHWIALSMNPYAGPPQKFDRIEGKSIHDPCPQCRIITDIDLTVRQRAACVL
eukprot:236454-Amphidinium_carterae.1